MTQTLAKRLFGVFTGALIGYAFGWILVLQRDFTFKTPALWAEFTFKVTL
jgi:ABC-type microcin C transport system permease subunit YejE